MPFGDPGKGEFRNAIVSCRNTHIAVGLAPLMDMREELTTTDDLGVRVGFDTPTKDHFVVLLARCDRFRRFVTHNPEDLPLGDLIAKAADVEGEIDTGVKPFAGDSVQRGSGTLYDLPWDLSGVSSNIPLADKLEMSSYGMILLQGVNRAIVAWTRLNSRDASSHITPTDSLRIYTHYQEILAHLETFGGDETRVDLAQVRASDEPRGPANAPNRKTETGGDQLGTT